MSEQDIHTQLIAIVRDISPALAAAIKTNGQTELRPKQDGLFAERLRHDVP